MKGGIGHFRFTVEQRVPDAMFLPNIPQPLPVGNTILVGPVQPYFCFDGLAKCVPDSGKKLASDPTKAITWRLITGYC
jgi:hypothetical protein